MLRTKKRILLIDKDADTCEMMDVLFTYAGYEFASANTMSDGHALAKTDSFDLILVDYYLPDGYGLELIKHVRQFDGRIPILFYSGEAHEDKIKEALQAEVQGYLIKPVDVDTVLRTVALYLNR